MDGRKIFPGLDPRFADEAFDELKRAVGQGFAYVPGFGVPENYLCDKGFCRGGYEEQRRTLYPTEKGKKFIKAINS